MPFPARHHGASTVEEQFVPFDLATTPIMMAMLVPVSAMALGLPFNHLVVELVVHQHSRLVGIEL